MTDLSKYSNFKVNGIPFYTNKNAAIEVMKKVIAQCPKDKFVVAQTCDYTRDGETREKLYCKYGTVTEVEFVELLKKDFQIYDMLQTNEMFKYLRIVFDIDMEGLDVTDPLDGCTALITEKFPGAILNVSGSIAQTTKGTKYSYHIVLFNYVMDENDYEILKVFCLQHKAELGFDNSIYKVNGQYKCVNQAKKDGRIQKIISGSENPLDHSLRCNIPSDPKTMADSLLKAEDFETKKRRRRPKKNKDAEKKSLN